MISVDEPLLYGIALPASLEGGDLRQQPYPCDLGAACGYTSELQRRRQEFADALTVTPAGMRITNTETGEVVHDSTTHGAGSSVLELAATAGDS